MTTVVTVRRSKEKCKFNAKTEEFSFDFVIINSDKTCCIRRSGNNQYTWVQLPTKHTDIYERYNALAAAHQRDLLEKYVLPKIIREKQILKR